MTIGVLDEYREMKIGTNLLNKIINVDLTDNLCAGIYLDIVYYNHIAIKFYQNNNFKKVSTIRNYYNLNKGKYDCNIFLRIFKREEKDEFKEKTRNWYEKNANYYYYF